MNRWIAGLVVAAVAAAVIAGAAAAAPAGAVTAQTDAPNGSGADSGAENATLDLSPGEQLAGVVGVQGAEIEGEVESRAFAVGLREAAGNESRAAVVAERLNRTEARLAELEQRQEALRERRAAGELSQGEYAARMATTTARIETLSRGLNRSASAAAELPAAVRSEAGVDGDRLTALRERASALSGPEVAAIARGVAGDGVGGPVASGRGPPEDRGPEAGGPPDDRGPGEDDEAGPPNEEDREDGESDADDGSERRGPLDGNGEDGAPNGSDPRDGDEADDEPGAAPGGPPDESDGNGSGGGPGAGGSDDRGSEGDESSDDESEQDGDEPSVTSPRGVVDAHPGRDA
ncbi:hypothetical protein [Halorubrum tropicale]|uniref:hypothetical protein n=1 Tax=Halorubrum tropicale TaxID=1765655 RepID=UPI0006B1B107|nr:hypothetical protein [Halorubrum tropicale]